MLNSFQEYIRFILNNLTFRNILDLFSIDIHEEHDRKSYPKFIIEKSRRINCYAKYSFTTVIHYISYIKQLFYNKTRTLHYFLLRHWHIIKALLLIKKNYEIIEKLALKVTKTDTFKYFVRPRKVHDILTLINEMLSWKIKSVITFT